MNTHFIKTLFIKTSVSFGYEQDNGNIHYTIINNISNDDIQKYILLRKVPINYNKINIVSSIAEYFDEINYEKDNTYSRILYMLNGKIDIRSN